MPIKPCSELRPREWPRRLTDRPLDAFTERQFSAWRTVLVLFLVVIKKFQFDEKRLTRDLASAIEKVRKPGAWPMPIKPCPELRPCEWPRRLTVRLLDPFTERQFSAWRTVLDSFLVVVNKFLFNKILLIFTWKDTGLDISTTNRGK